MNNKLHFLIPLLMVVLSISMTSCSNNDAPEHKKDNMHLISMNITDAKYLIVRGADAGRDIEETHEYGLYKMDENGVISRVYITYSYDTETGETTKTESNIICQPSGVSNIEGVYTLLKGCYYQIEGTDEFIGGGMDDLPFNIVVNNRNGKIYNADNMYNDVFSGYYPFGTYVDRFGDVYILRKDLVGSISEIWRMDVNGNDLNVVRINPDNTTCDKILYVNSKGGTLLTKDLRDYYAFYPGGSFEILNTKTEDKFPIFIWPTSKGLLSAYIDIDWIKMNDYGDYYGNADLKIRKASIGSDIGSFIISEEDFVEPIAIDHWHELDYRGREHREFYESDKYYVIGSLGAIDKLSNAFVYFTDDQANHVDRDLRVENIYSGKSWQISDDEKIGKWFDLNTLSYGEVSYARAYDGMIINKNEKLINKGMIVLQGVKFSDGSQTIRTVDIVTGEYDEVTTPSSFGSYTLIPLN